MYDAALCSLVYCLDSLGQQCLSVLPAIGDGSVGLLYQGLDSALRVDVARSELARLLDILNN